MVLPLVAGQAGALDRSAQSTPHWVYAWHTLGVVAKPPALRRPPRPSSTTSSRITECSLGSQVLKNRDRFRRRPRTLVRLLNDPGELNRASVARAGRSRRGCSAYDEVQPQWFGTRRSVRCDCRWSMVGIDRVGPGRGHRCDIDLRSVMVWTCRSLQERVSTPTISTGSADSRLPIGIRSKAPWPPPPAPPVPASRPSASTSLMAPAAGQQPVLRPAASSRPARSGCTSRRSRSDTGADNGSALRTSRRSTARTVWSARSTRVAVTALDGFGVHVPRSSAGSRPDSINDAPATQLGSTSRRKVSVMQCHRCNSQRGHHSPPSRTSTTRCHMPRETALNASRLGGQNGPGKSPKPSSPCDGG
jgi:hypothetical protein